MCGVLSAKDAEVYGLREAISWALMMGFSSVTFELDTKIIVDAFYSTKPYDSKFGIVVQDCHFLCQRGLQYSVCFARRQANKAAHALVR